MGLLSDMKRLLFGATSIAKSAAEKAAVEQRGTVGDMFLARWRGSCMLRCSRGDAPVISVGSARARGGAKRHGRRGDARCRRARDRLDGGQLCTRNGDALRMRD